MDEESATAFSDLKAYFENSSSMAGILVALSKDINEEGIKSLCSRISSIIGSAESCLVMGYATLMFFTNKVLCLQKLYRCINTHGYICIYYIYKNIYNIYTYIYKAWLVGVCNK